jgi:hypothetical protein
MSLPGHGKSAICEGIAALNINPDCDCFGFRLTPPPSYSKILYIDGEKTNEENEEAWNRIHKRAGKTEQTKKIIYEGMKHYPIAKRLDWIKDMLVKNPDIFLIIIDGIGDIEPDVNNTEKSNQLYDTLASFNPNIAFLCTIHANPGDNKYELKPRGHVGSELLRRSQAIMMCIMDEDGIVEISAGSKHGKIRKGNRFHNSCATAMIFNEENGMFITTEIAVREPKKEEKREKYIEVAKRIYDFAKRDELTYSYIVEQIVKMFKKTKAAAEKYFERNLMPVLHVVSEGIYSFNKPINQTIPFTDILQTNPQTN